ncbi:serine protease, partial [Candidatus Woesearchaeota archaeon]|nr:serine protease [Candidatus Woesearchaeota archaeon]
MSLVDRLKKAVKVGALVGLVSVLAAEGAYYYNTTPKQRAQHAAVVREVASVGYNKAKTVARGGFNLARNYFGSAFDGKYDNHNLFCRDNLENLLNPVHKVHSYVEWEVHDYKYKNDGVHVDVKKKSDEGHGSGLVIDNNGERLKFLTCNHVVAVPAPVKWYRNKRLVREIKNVRARYTLVQASIRVPVVAPPFFGSKTIHFGLSLDCVARDARNDLALLETRLSDINRIKAYKPWKSFGSSSELEPGDFLYVVGFPYEFRRQLTHGRISSSYGVISSADV